MAVHLPYQHFAGNRLSKGAASTAANGATGGGPPNKPFKIKLQSKHGVWFTPDQYHNNIINMHGDS